MIHICDNFLEDPYKIRKIALSSSFDVDPFGCWPGKRTKDIPNHIEEYLLSRVKTITKKNSLKYFNKAFQYSVSKYGEGLYHADSDGPGKYTCIIYLCENNSIDCGTEISETGYNRKYNQTTWDKHIDTKIKFYKNPDRFLTKIKHNMLTKKVNTFIDTNYIVPCRFNRMVVFDSHFYHRAQKFFGSSIKDSRLTLISFFEYEI